MMGTMTGTSMAMNLSWGVSFLMVEVVWFWVLAREGLAVAVAMMEGGMELEELGIGIGDNTIAELVLVEASGAVVGRIVGIVRIVGATSMLEVDVVGTMGMIGEVSMGADEIIAGAGEAGVGVVTALMVKV